MLGESTRSGNRSGDVSNLEERETVMDFNTTTTTTMKGNKIIIPLKGDAVVATIQPDLNESIHMTRHSRVIKKPNKYSDNLPSSTTITNHSSTTNSNLSTPLPSPTKHSRRSSINNITPPTIIINPIPTAITLNFTSLSSSSNVISSPLQFQQPSTTTSALDSITSIILPPSISAADKKRHPRDLVPLDIGFPTLSTKEKVQPADQEDRILMAICRILMDFDNRALCPKEIADTMEERGWLMNAGTTPFAHVSTCIRSHLKRASTSIPPYQPLLISFELAGSISPLELQAIGLVAHEQPAVKRGTLWYLDERAFGSNVGAEDPFNRIRKENGLEPTGKDGIYVRGVNAVPVAVPPANAMIVEEDDDHDGMGRGKRKRRASTAASGGTLELLAPSILSSSTSTSISATASTSTSTTSVPIPIPIPTKYKHIVGQAHHWSTTRKNAAAASAAAASEINNNTSTPSSTTTTTSIISTSAPSKLGIPRLRLKLSALEEVDSSHDDSDGQTSDAVARRKNRKKPRRAASEGGRWVTSRGGGPVRVGRGRPRIRISAGGSSNGTDTRSERSEKMEEDSSRSSSEDEQEVEEEPEKIMLSRSTPAAFSSASSTALLAKSLLAASTSNSTTSIINVSTPAQSVIAPNSLHYSSFDSRIGTNQRHLLSMSAPSPYSATTFTSLHSRDPMDVESVASIIKEEELEDDEADQDDFNEAMLRGEDFDFEWATESYSAPNSPLLLPLPTPSYPITNTETSSSLTTTVQSKSPTLSIITISPSKEKGKEREISLGPPDEPFDLDLGLDLAEGMDDASTPATTPRSPPAKEEEFIETPTTGTFRGGLEVTLCGVFAQEGEEDSKPDTGLSQLDRTASTDSLTSLVEDDQDEPEHPTPVTQLAVDATTLSLPLPSPLALELPPMLSLTNNAFSPDYDFVGHEEDDLSAYRNYQYDGDDRDGAESADDEDEDDEIVTIKLEDDSPTGSATNSARSSRQSSACAYPLESFSRRLMVTNLSNSSSSTGSDSEDHFDSHMIVSNSLLATGMAVPLVAPSPPELTEWGIELDDLDVELGSDTELVGPENVGLDELDAAWGGSGSSQVLETSESMDLEEDSKLKHIEEDLASTSSFLTRSPINNQYSPIMSPVRSIESSLSSLPLPSPAIDSSSSVTKSTEFQASHPDTSSIVVYPTIPLSPVIIAKIVQKGVAVYSTEIIDVDTQVTYSLLRRIDTDFVNCTNLLRLTHTSLVEREKIISELGETLKVVSGGSEIEGQWLPLASALKIKEMFKVSLSSLDVFLKGDLGSFFPAPIPSLTNWAAQQDSVASSVPTVVVVPKSKARRGSNAKAARRRSLMTEESERESSPELLPTRIPGARGSRRN